MLQIWTGRSRRLWPRVLEGMGAAYRSGAQRLFLITPDQYTLQAELELVEKLNLPGLLQMEVLSPARLKMRVFQLAGSPQRVQIDARGKAMMLEDVIRLSAEDLRYYAGAADRRGFAQKVAASIGEMKRAGQGPDDVLALAESLPKGDALREKMLDQALLYARYEQRLEGAFIDGEDAQEAMLKRLPQSGLLQGAQVWIYGFDLITPQFARQIILMERLAKSVCLTLTWENAAARDGLVFTPARDTLTRLTRYLDEAQVQRRHEHVVGILEAAEPICHLEQELFAVPPVPYEGDASAITLRVAASPYEEAMQTAADMLRMHAQGIAFDEMAVIAGEIEGYAGAIEMAFDRSGIPHHITRQRAALSHPLLRSWMAGIRCATQRFAADDAMDWLKGGFCGLTIEEAERLENYAIEHGLKGRAKWSRVIDEPQLESARQRFMAPLEALADRLRKARTNTASLAAVYGLLEDTGAYGTLCAWQEVLTAKGRLAEAAECAQAWRLAMETLDQLHALLGGGRMDMAGIARVMESGLAAAELGAVPASPGMVQVGQLGHAKLGGTCRVLFLMGMQDGVMRTETTGLLSDLEIMTLSQKTEGGAAFGLRGDELAQLVQINLLDTLAAPAERLIISHASSGTGGETNRPAPVLRLLKKVFPSLVEEGSAIEKRQTLGNAPGTALDAMGPVLRAAALRGEALSQAEEGTLAWLLHAPATRTLAQKVLRALQEPMPPQTLGKRTMDRLYAHTRTSVSRLETFAQCPFKHYVAYGLRPVPRKDFTVARNETGSFYHRAMEGYTLEAAKYPGWPEVDHAQSDAIMDAVLQPLKAEWASSPLGDNAMLKATGEAFCRVARRAAWTFAGQMRRGGFRTGRIEARFGAGEMLPPITLVLPDGSQRWVEGRIDRIDFYEEEGHQWLRVVDYKSGDTTLEPSRLYGGLQLQLMLYLAAALAAFPGMEAAGAFYARLDDPLILTDSKDIEEIESKLAQELRLKGIALSDVRVIRAMDDEDLLKKDGTPKKAAALTSADGLAALMSHAYTLASSMAGQIAEGEMVARPAALEGWNACQWCEYQSICGFDMSVQGHQRRTLEKLNRDALLEKLGVEGEDT